MRTGCRLIRSLIAKVPGDLQQRAGETESFWTRRGLTCEALNGAVSAENAAGK